MFNREAATGSSLTTEEQIKATRLLVRSKQSLEACKIPSDGGTGQRERGRMLCCVHVWVCMQARELMEVSTWVGANPVCTRGSPVRARRARVHAQGERRCLASSWKRWQMRSCWQTPHAWPHAAVGKGQEDPPQCDAG